MTTRVFGIRYLSLTEKSQVDEEHSIIALFANIVVKENVTEMFTISGCFKYHHIRSNTSYVSCFSVFRASECHLALASVKTWEFKGESLNHRLLALCACPACTLFLSVHAPNRSLVTSNQGELKVDCT